MATAKFTLGSVLRTVSSTAGMITNIVSTVGTAAEVANSYVSSAALRQKQRQNIDDTSWLEQYIDDRSVELTESKEILGVWLEKSPTRKLEFDSIRSKLLAAANYEEAQPKD